MGLFDKKAKPTKIEIPEPWPYAREITPEQANRKGELPLGWYFWQEGFIWYAMRPDPETGELERSWNKRDPKDLEEWLGVPVKRNVEINKENLTEKVNKAYQDKDGGNYLDRMGLAGKGQPATRRQPPSDKEKEWVEQKVVEELREPPAPLEEKQRKKRKGLGRTNQIKTRLTDGELRQFQSRVKKSGLPQGEFLRSAALTGQIVIQENNPADIALLDELALIRAELGRQGGMLKMIIKPNEGQRELAPDEWAALIQAVRDMERMKNRLSDMGVKLTNGTHKTPNKQER